MAAASRFGVNLMPDEARALLAHDEIVIAWQSAAQLGVASDVDGERREGRAVSFIPDPFAGGLDVDHRVFDKMLAGLTAGGVKS